MQGKHRYYFYIRIECNINLTNELPLMPFEKFKILVYLPLFYIHFLLFLKHRTYNI